MTQCPYCGVEASESSVFCGKCGRYLGICPRCRTAIPREQLPSTDFCPMCGQQLKTILVTKPTKRITWGIRDMLKPLVAFVAIEVALSAVPYIGVSITRPWLVAYLFLSLSIPYLSLLALTIYSIRKRGGKLADIGIYNAPPKYVATGIFLGFVLVGVSSAISILLSPFGISPQQGEEIRQIMRLPNALPTLLLWGGFLGPIIEEIYFRGFSHNAFKSKLGKKTAMLASALFFSLAHLDPSGIIYYTILGILLAYAYERTNSLPLVTLAHITNNTIALALAFLIV